MNVTHKALWKNKHSLDPRAKSSSQLLALGKLKSWVNCPHIPLEWSVAGHPTQHLEQKHPSGSHSSSDAGWENYRGLSRQFVDNPTAISTFCGKDGRSFFRF